MNSAIGHKSEEKQQSEKNEKGQYSGQWSYRVETFQFIVDVKYKFKLIGQEL